MKTPAIASWLFCLLLCPQLATQVEEPPLPPGHLGVYHWSGQAPKRAAADDLSAALGDITRLGFGAVRVFVGGRYDYVHPLGSPHRFSGAARPLTLSGILALPRYKSLFEQSQLKTIWLTAYPVFDYGRGPDEIDLRRSVAEPEWQQEYDQMRRAAEWLYRNFGSHDKLVLITNHEADEKLLEVLNASGDERLAVDNVARDLQTRWRAVSDARRHFPSARLKVFFGAEISLWKLRLARTPSGTWIKGERGLNALEAVLPRLDYDFVSFSAWETVARPNPAAALAEAVKDIGARTGQRVSPAGRAFFGANHVLLGEFGYAREWKLPNKAMTAGMNAILGAVAAGQVPYAVYWQLYDNTEGDVKGFGLLDPAGKFTCAGVELFRRIKRKAPPASAVSCPQ